MAEPHAGEGRSSGGNSCRRYGKTPCKEKGIARRAAAAAAAAAAAQGTQGNSRKGAGKLSASALVAQ